MKTDTYAQKQFPYMGRMITAIDRIVHWSVIVDGSLLLSHNETPVEFTCRRDAVVAGFDFVYKLSVDEGKVDK